MKKPVFRMFGISTVVLSAFLSHAGADCPARAAVENAIEVRQVCGVAEYAYDSTGWRPLRAGKVLHAGASVRTALTWWTKPGRWPSSAFVATRWLTIS